MLNNTSPLYCDYGYYEDNELDTVVINDTTLYEDCFELFDELAEGFDEGHPI